MPPPRNTSDGRGALRSVRVSGSGPSSSGPSSPDTGAGRQVTHFGHLLRELRAKRGISQAAVAKAAGVSAGYVGLIETGDRGERPSLDIVRRFGQAVNASVAEMESLLRATGHLGPDEQLIPDDRPSFAQFVDADPRLSRSQKNLLKGIYDSWVGND